MVVLGGYKATDIYVTLKDLNQLDNENGITEYIIYELSDLMGAKFLPKDKIDDFVRASIGSWNNEDAQRIANEILGNITEPITLSGVEERGKEFMLDNTRVKSQERGE